MELVPEVGLKVTSSPPASTAVHWLAAGQATDCSAPESSRTGEFWSILGFGGSGKKVTWLPLVSTMVHWLEPETVWHATEVAGTASRDREPPLFCWPVVGLKVISLPPPSTAVHSVVDTQAIPVRALFVVSMTDTPAPLAAPVVGSNVTSLLPDSIAVHWVRLGHAMPESDGEATGCGVVKVPLGVKPTSWLRLSTAAQAVVLAGQETAMRGTLEMPGWSMPWTAAPGVAVGA